MALAKRLAQAGVEVALAARREKPLYDLACDIARAGGKTRYYLLDVSNPEATVATLQRADDEMGGIDVVVANAGVGRSRWGGELRWQDCAEIISVNVAGAVATLTALIGRMVARGKGQLAGMSSLAQYRGQPLNAAYSASKSFLSTFLESLRVDLRRTGVSVTDVRPGFVRTPMTELQQMHRPFLMEPEAAAEIIVRGLDRRAPVIAFPWQLATVVRSTRLLPSSVYDRAIALASGPRARQ